MVAPSSSPKRSTPGGSTGQDITPEQARAELRRRALPKTDGRRIAGRAEAVASGAFWARTSELESLARESGS